MAARRLTKPPVDKQCDVCGAQFKSSQPSAKRCSADCRAEHKRRSERVRLRVARTRDPHIAKMQRACDVCGTLYRRVSNTKTCSPGCSIILKRATKRRGHEKERTHPEYAERRRQIERARSAASSVGYVYVLTLPSYPQECKIGYALDVGRRLDDHRCTRYDVRVEAVFSGGRLLEVWLHDQFRNKRIAREWFSVTADRIVEEVKLYPLTANVIPFIESATGFQLDRGW